MAKKKTTKGRRLDIKITPKGLKTGPAGPGGGVLITTSRGVEVECLPIADTLDAHEENIRASVEWPEMPVRVMVDVAGSEMESPLSQEYVESAQATDEEKEAWAEYQIAQAEAQAQFKAKLDENRVRLIAFKGVQWNGKLEEEWAADHEWLGTTVPEGERERKLHFFRTEVLGNIGDLYTVLFGIYQASGYDEEVLDMMEASFRPEMGRAEGDAAEDGTGDTGEESEAVLVEQPQVDGDGDGAGVRADA